MRIGSSLPSLPTSVFDRGPGAVPNPGRAEADAAPPPRGELTRIRSRAADPVQNLSDRALPPRRRDALQSYLANGPSLSERLGVELAGIDVLV